MSTIQKKVNENTEKQENIKFDKFNIYQKINHVKKHDLSVKRDTKAYNYKYATLDQIQKKLNPLLTEVWLVITHQIKEKSVITRIVNIDNPEEFLESILEMKEWLNPQQKGSEITYYRRYNVLSLLDLEVEDDDWKAATDAAEKNKNKNQGDEKPWYNDFNKHKNIMLERIKAGETPEDILKSLKEKFLVSKKIQEEIMNLI